MDVTSNTNKTYTVGYDEDYQKIVDDYYNHTSSTWGIGTVTGTSTGTSISTGTFPYSGSGVSYPDWSKSYTLTADPELPEKVEELGKKVDKICHLLGIMADEPNEEDLENHKALKDACNRYKFLEKLILGKTSDAE